MGLFEQYPWLLVPIIIATVEGWTAVKALTKDLMRRRHSNLPGGVTRHQT